MSPQLTLSRKTFWFGAVAVGVVAIVLLVLNGDDGIERTVARSFEDVAIGRDAVGTADGLPAGAPGGAAAVKGSEAQPLAPSSAPVTNSRGSVGQESTPNGTAALVDDRKIVMTASMRLQVREVGTSFEEVGRIATSAGGFVAGSSFSNQGEQQVASLTIRVPSSRYQQVLSDLRALGVKVVNEDSKSNDVTAEYTDLAARLRNLEATEAQLLQLLGRANTIGEILQVQDRLNAVRTEIEQVKGRMAMYDKLTDLATITVHLAPVPAATGGSDGNRISNEISRAWNESIDFLTDIAASVAHAIVFIWWLPLLAVPLLIVGRLWLRRPRPIEAVD